ncbi:hypothetical protein [Bythopirellula goksoeyrii]|uniref:Uncharacterized protein n=1 Tax=Bythopirellula goksoeyrii TaxID=1400387 RepID=A0A5B9QEL7_9BACT|nr:hypothetical protein [Bythopirellula goksoeyrii]QEG36080.1 hypothetical protein Pr1d_33890 [Bythopirellula goksoeyrii]
MSLQVNHPDEFAKMVLERSEAKGTSPEAVVISAVREILAGEERLSDELAPVAEAFTKKEMTEAE